MDLVVSSALARSVTAVFERVSVKLENWNFTSMCVSVAAFRKHSLKVKGQVFRWSSRSKNRQKMTILNVELSWYFRARKSICRSVAKMCTNMCSIHWDPIRPELMMLGGVTEQKPYVRLSKMTAKKWKSAKRAFLGRFLTFWLNLIRTIRILQKIWLLDDVCPRYGPSVRKPKFENDQKVK